MEGITINNKISQISQEDFNFLLKNGKRSSKLFNFDFESLILSSWGVVKETIPYFIQNNDFDNLFLLMLKDREQHYFLIDVQRIDIKDSVSFLLWIIDELKALNELESTHLSSSPDAKMINAGINKLDKFGYKNTLRQLAKGDLTKYDEIKKKPYHFIFDEQLMNVIHIEIEKKLINSK